ncbi:uncharacterized protein LOC116550186 [Sapajus apella]|uniref:Uncharacterized protein LOC116550186 n=1 Tax=Sapajus apella TaxID=9515 RepID=A0A6J3HQM9_SAPAP|nr:uncharacterized protein LOC116550186 [Sapajus apella]
MGSGGSRLANYGARAQPAPCAQPPRKGPAVLDLLLRQEGGDLGPGTAGQWQRAGAAGSDTRCFPASPEVTGPQVGWEAVLWPSGAAARGAGVQFPSGLRALSYESGSEGAGNTGFQGSDPAPQGGEPSHPLP